MAPSDSSEIPAAMRALGNKGTWPGDIKRLYSSFFLSYQVTTPELPLLLDSFDGRRHYEFDAFAVDGGFSTWDLPIQRFKVSNDEAAAASVARFDALTTTLQGKSTSIVFPDIYLQQRFLRALPTSGHRDFSEILDKHHRVGFSNLAELQKAVVDEEKVLMKKAAYSGDDPSAAAAAHATGANLVPVCTNAEKHKATMAQKCTKALSATSESSSVPPILFPCGPWSNAPAHADDSQHDLGTSSTEYNY